MYGMYIVLPKRVTSRMVIIQDSRKAKDEKAKSCISV